MYSQYPNNNICDLDSIAVHDIDFDLGNVNTNCYGTFTYGDYLQELQELEQGRTPMKIDRQSITRDLSNLHWVHNVGLPVDQQPQQQQQQQQQQRNNSTISLMVDPNTNMPVQFSRNGLHGSLQHQNITFMTIPQTQVLTHQPHTQQPTLYQRAELHQQNLLQQQKYLHEKNAKENGGGNGQKIFPKPVFSYSCLIAMALRNSDAGSLPVSEIYKYMQLYPISTPTRHLTSFRRRLTSSDVGTTLCDAGMLTGSRFPYFKTAPDGWKNSVRHNLSLNKAFCKLERPDGTSQRKGCLWSLKPEKKEQLRREIRKWKKKHPEAIKASMANPDDLSLSSDSLDDDSMEDTKTPSPEHTVPEAQITDQCPPPPRTLLREDDIKLEVKEEAIDEMAVENAAKELFGNDLLFNQEDLHSEEFWNDLIDSSENAAHLVSLEQQNKFLSDDLIEVESSIKLEDSNSNFFSSASKTHGLAGF